jgi:hypothetical protein
MVLSAMLCEPPKGFSRKMKSEDRKLINPKLTILPNRFAYRLIKKLFNTIEIRWSSMYAFILDSKRTPIEDTRQFLEYGNTGRVGLQIAATRLKSPEFLTVRINGRHWLFELSER